jgi:hypothetical protein
MQQRGDYIHRGAVAAVWCNERERGEERLFLSDAFFRFERIRCDATGTHPTRYLKQTFLLIEVSGRHDYKYLVLLTCLERNISHLLNTDIVN